MKAGSLESSRLVILSTIVRQLLSYGESRGLDPLAMRAVAQLPSDVEMEAESWLPLHCSMSLWAYLAKRLKDPGIPIHVAQSCRPEDYHALGFFAMACGDASELIDKIRYFSNFYTNSGNWEIKIGKDEISAIWRRDLPLDLGHRIANENGLAEIVHFFRHLTGRQLAPECVTFCHPRPADTTVHESFFGSPIAFDSSINSVTFPRGWLTIPLQQPNPALASFFDRYLRTRTGEIVGTASTSELVRDVVNHELPDSGITIVGVAKRLALSERTLRRLLAKEGTTFRKLVSAMRREKAEQLLKKTELTISEIAFRVGYSSVTAFSRAFRQQTGVAPRDIRHRISRYDRSH